MKLNKHDSQTEMEMNMTPMIDVTFLLIIFFMIITDLTQQDLEELKLPIAMQAIADEPDPTKVRPVVNVLSTGEVIVKRETLYDPETEESTLLERYLADQAAFMLSKEGNWEYIEEGNPNSKRIPGNPLLIRSDQNTPFNMIQKIMEICGKEGIQIWKLELAAAEDPEKAKEEEGN